MLPLIALVSTATYACTGVRTESENGDYFRGRTMEFAEFIPSDIIAIPAGHEYTGTTPDGSHGLEWISEYSVVGANGFGMPHIIDGLNEKGLTAGMFYFANYVGYNEPGDAASDAIAPWELCTWILGRFASVDELLLSLDQVRVCSVELEEFGFAPPLHYIVMDATGDCVVLEHIDGQLVVYDNPLGVITNSPSFDWHVTNLKNYVNLSAVNRSPFVLSGIEISEMGQGSGLLGMPGDFTPPSRFVRAAVYSANTPPAESPDDGVLQTFHVLNQFDIPLGASMRPEPDEQGNPIYDYTLWSSVSDMTRCRYYFRTYDDSSIRMVDLMSLDLSGGDVLTFPMEGTEEIIDISEYLR